MHAVDESPDPDSKVKHKKQQAPVRKFNMGFGTSSTMQAGKQARSNHTRSKSIRRKHKIVQHRVKRMPDRQGLPAMNQQIHRSQNKVQNTLHRGIPHSTLALHLGVERVVLKT